MTRPHIVVLAGSLLAALACGGKQPETAVPVQPEAAIRAFLGGVKARSTYAMGEVWGTASGPARGSMSRQDLEQRLTVTRIYLEHESFEILPESRSANASGSERVFEVRLTRRGCAPVVPFTVVRYRGGWLVKQVDIAAAGNPAVPCRRPSGGR